MGLCKDDGSRTPEYTAKDISKIYQEHGHIIFSRSLQHRMLSVDGLSNKKYTEKGITSILDKYFGHVHLGTALTHVLITSYDIQNREPFFFKSWRDNFQSVEMRDVAKATSAAPTYFEPALVPIDGAVRALIDGGIFINNPSVSAYVEAMKVFPGEDIKLISIGTGEMIRPFSYDKAKNWGKVG